MTKHITYVTFDMHQDSITAAWVQADAQTPEVRAIPHEPKCFRQLVRQLLGHGLACLLRGGPPGICPPAVTRGLGPPLRGDRSRPHPATAVLWRRCGLIGFTPFRRTSIQLAQHPGTDEGFRGPFPVSERDALGASGRAFF